jgi:hypothetical protein
MLHLKKDALMTTGYQAIIDYSLKPQRQPLQVLRKYM